MNTVIRQLRDLLSRRDQVLFLIVMMLLAVLALLEMVGIAAIMPFLALATNPETIQTNQWLQRAYRLFNFSSNDSFLAFFGYLVLALIVLSNVGKAVGVWLTLRYENRLVRNMSRQLLASYMARPYKFFLGRNTGSLGSTLLVEVGRVTSGVLAPITVIAANLFTSMALLAMLVAVDPLVAIAIPTILGGVYITVYVFVRRKLVTVGQRQVEASTQKFISASESLQGIKDLKVLAREYAFLQRFSRFARMHAKANVVGGVITQFPRYALEIIAFGGVLLLVLHLIGQGQQSSQMVPILALYAFAGYRLLPALQTIFAAATTVRVNVPALNLLHAELTGPESVQEPEAQLEAASTALPLAFTHTLELRGISFRYDGVDEDSVRDLDMIIPSHASVGLVGPTGCGKTTTVDLILGLLTPQKGRILVDGVEIDDSNMAGWHKILGYVPQQIYISDTTIAKNIAFGVAESEIDMDAVRRAAAVAHLDQFIETQLPQGYQTEIGERGIRLSGGQRQRIGIARALYRDPAILIMDEATSALDGVTEEGVMDAVRGLSGKKTVILIAHRLTTVKDCDRIYQLDRGSVAASGTFHELLQTSPWFRAAAKGSDTH